MAEPKQSIVRWCFRCQQNTTYTFAGKKSTDAKSRIERTHAYHCGGCGKQIDCEEPPDDASPPGRGSSPPSGTVMYKREIK